MSDGLENENIQNESFENINQAILQDNIEKWKNYVNEKTYEEFIKEQEIKLQNDVDIEVEKRKNDLGGQNEIQRADVEKELRLQPSRLFVSYDDYINEYRKQNFNKIVDKTDSLLRNLNNQKTYDLSNYDETDVDGINKVNEYKAKCEEIERWKKLILEPYPTKEMLPENEKNDLEKTRMPFSREYCINKCKNAILEMMETMEQTMARTINNEVIKIKAGDIGEGKIDSKNIKDIFIDIDTGDKEPYNNLEELLTSVNRLGEAAQSLYDGELEVPNPDAKEINGKKYHTIDATKFESRYIKGIYVRNNKGVREKKEVKEINLDEIDKTNEPLFLHEPCKEDIEQGALGDCYMLSSLSAIAAQDPQKIKDMMKDNNDGTVTVRLFNDNQEPVFITVTKTIAKNPKGDYAAYAGKSLWVQMMEKAFAASGEVANDYSSDISLSNKPDRKIDYMNIGNGGESYQFIHRVLGTNPMVFAGNANLFYTHRVTEDKKPNNNQPYTEEELSVAKFIEKEQKEEKIITATTYNDLKVDAAKIIDLEKKGIFHLHSYTLLGLDKDEDGTIYVKVRNPHNYKGVIQQKEPDGTISEVITNGGVCRLELREFQKYYGTVYSNKYDLTPSRREKLPEARDLIRRYGNTVNEIYKSLKSSDNIFLSAKNSKAFKDFKEAADSVKQAMETKCPDPEAIDKAMKSLFEKAAEYESYCVNDKKIDITEASDRAVQRYKASVITSDLMEIYKHNEPKDRTYESRLAAESIKKVECSYMKLSEACGIPTNGWEQISVADKSIAERIKGMDSVDKRKDFYREIEDFLDKNGDLAFRSDKIKEMNSGKKNTYFKENRQDLEMMIAVSKYGNKIAELMKADGYENDHGRQVQELEIKNQLFNDIFNKTKAITDPTRYASEQNILGKGENIVKDFFNNVNEKAKQAEEIVNKIDKQKAIEKKQQDKTIQQQKLDSSFAL